MKLKIKSIILYPENKELSPRFLKFSEEKINVISGYSQRGKSAIISIIDYCLASSDCNIPIGLIRDKVDKFAIYITIGNKNLFIARDSPHRKNNTEIMYFHEIQGKGDRPIFNTNEWIENSDDYKTTRDYIKRYLNSLAGFENISEEQNSEGKDDPAGFRDTVAFLFQPQNIIANPTTIFYKTDTLDHLLKLKSIFPLILGYKSFEIIKLEKEINILEKDYQDQKRKYETIQYQYQSWSSDVYNYYSQAINLGITDKIIKIEEASIEALKDELTLIIKRVKSKNYLKEGSSLRYANQLDELDKLRQKAYQDLKLLKIELYKYEQVDRTKNSYKDDVLYDIVDRLSPLSWFLDKEGTNVCPFCKSKSDAGINKLLTLRNEQDKIQPVLKDFELSLFSFEKEKIECKKNIKEKETFIQRIESNINILLNENIKENNKFSNIFEFVGKINNILENLAKLEPSNDLAQKIESIKNELETKRAEQKELSMKFDKESCLNSVSNSIDRYIKSLPIEDKQSKRVHLDPDKSINIKIEDVRTKNITFLSKIGSGANHMCYHLATLLGLHEYFLLMQKQHKHNFIPSFLVLDQPSQVYFPEGFPGEKGSSKKTEERYSKDFSDTKSIFEVCSLFMERTKGHTQIIILEHASSKIWEGIPDINLVQEWRGEENTEEYNALLPSEWLLAG
jgi:hypothetical protein